MTRGACHSLNWQVWRQLASGLKARAGTVDSFLAMRKTAHSVAVTGSPGPTGPYARWKRTSEPE